MMGQQTLTNLLFMNKRQHHLKKKGRQTQSLHELYKYPCSECDNHANLKSNNHHQAIRQGRKEEWDEEATTQGNLKQHH